MENNKIVVIANPTCLFQKIFVSKNDEVIDQFGVTYDDIQDITYALVDKYDITDIFFSGPMSYVEKIAKDIENNQVIRYGMTKIKVHFI